MAARLTPAKRQHSVEVVTRRLVVRAAAAGQIDKVSRRLRPRCVFQEGLPFLAWDPVYIPPKGPLNRHKWYPVELVLVVLLLLSSLTDVYRFRASLDYALQCPDTPYAVSEWISRLIFVHR